MSNDQLYKDLEETANFIKENIDLSEVSTAITLGSGLGLFVDALQEQQIIPYEKIPHFHKTSVAGHAGRLVVGKVNDTKVLALQGRLHAYEGHSWSEVVYPTRCLKTLGLKNLILTNASGGMNPHFSAGDLILIKDHINLTGSNPLFGPNLEKLGPRFPDMTHTWNPELQQAIKKACAQIKYNLKDGVYMGVLGPSYETPAEIKMYQSMGADMVGMSTVAEAIAAHHCGLKVAGISCITNMAAGLSPTELNHDDIKDEANKVKEVFVNLLIKTLEQV